MIQSALNIRECCAGCRRPVSRCMCSASQTYRGIMVRGEWKPLQDPPIRVIAERPHAASASR